MSVRHGSSEQTLRAAWAPSLVRRMMRHRLVWASAAISLVLAGAAGFASQIASIDRERSRWGETASAVVVVDPVGTGEPLAGSVRVVDLPVAMIPDSALGSVPDAGRAKVVLHAGEVLLSSRVVGEGNSALPDHTVALTLPIIARVPLVEEGDLVDLYVVDAANFSSRRVARYVTVLVIEDKAITVAMPETKVAEATAASLRPVTVVLVG